MINGELQIFERFEDIPEDFDHVIEFVPEIPDGPHTHEQHEEIEKWNDSVRTSWSREVIRSKAINFRKVLPI